jgi:probable phosphoglycerate mutase
VLAEAGERCGLTTNNVAEYSGLLAGLRLAAALDPTARVEVRMDSKLVVEQMSGRWKIKDRRLAGIAAQASRAFDPALVRYTWVPRAQNAAADRLANDAMDGTERRVEEMVAMLASDPDPTSSHDATDPVGAADPAPDPVPSRAAAAAAAAGAAAAGAVPLGPASPTWGRRRRSCWSVTAAPGSPRNAGSPAPRPGRPADRRRPSGRGGGRALPGGVDVDAVVTSPLLRARQTADLLGERLGWPRAAVDDRWAEVAFGEWDSLTAAEVSARDPELFRRWLGEASTRPPGGESMLDLEVRVAEGLSELLQQHRGGTVVVVCHMTPVRSVVRQLLGAGEEALWRLRFAPGSLTTTRHWPDGGAEVDGVGLHVPPQGSTLF